jgi:hypothetical protein
MRARFGGRRPFAGLDIASRHPAFGWCSLRLQEGDRWAAQRIWQETGADFEIGDFDTMIAALPPARGYLVAQYKAVVEEGLATNFWTHDILSENAGMRDVKERFFNRVQELLAEAEGEGD